MPTATSRQLSNAGAAAAGAGYANRNQPGLSNAGAAAAGRGTPIATRALFQRRCRRRRAGYANRNQSPYPNAGAAAAGAGYANHNQYNQYHPGMTNGYWNGNYGAWGTGTAGYGGVAAWGVGSPMYGYGYSGYSNPYAPAWSEPARASRCQPGGYSAYDYSQPLNTAAAPPEQTAADQATAAFDQARDAFKSNDYATALQRDSAGARADAE